MRADFAAAARSYDSAAVLAREVGARMAARLDLVKIAPQRIADIGCATGDGIRDLQQRYVQGVALCARLRLAHAARRAPGDSTPAAADGARPAPGQCRRSPSCRWPPIRWDWSGPTSCCTGWTIRCRRCKELHRVLEVGGLLSFATLGPDTLKELRAAAGKVGAGDTAKRFLDMHDLGDMLVAAGFGDPVMDMEMITLTYATPRAFLSDQRRLGVRDALLGRQPWRDWRRLFQRLGAGCRAAPAGQF